MTRIAISLLGPFDATIDGRGFLRSGMGKSHGLLAYLAMESAKAHRRAELAELFWPDQDPERGRHRLRQMLFDLQKELRGREGVAPMLSLDKESARFRADAAWLDVAEFGKASECSPAPERCPRCLAQMESRIGLYRGEFMAGLSLPNCPEFEDWLLMQRESLHRHALALLEQLSNCHEQAANLPSALQFALRHIELSPWDEFAHRRVMLLYALNGQGSAAMHQYERCRHLLESGLGALPGKETQLLAERIRNGEFLQGWEDKSPPFEAWLEEQRRRWKARACSLYVRIAEDCARRGMVQAALDAAERAVEIDHADGHCLRTFLRLLAQSGRGVELAYEYDRHVRYLREEFDVEPEAATLHLYRQLVVASQADQKVIPAGEDDAGILSRLHTAHHAMLRWDFVGAQELCRQIGGLLPRLPATSTRDVLHAEWRTLSNIADERQADRKKVEAVKGPLSRAMEKLPEGVFVMRFAAWAGAESRRGPAAAERNARQLVKLSARCGGWARRRADMALTLVLFWQGKFVEARSIAESVELPALLPADVLERYGGGSVEIMVPCMLAWVLLFCGEADTANARMAHALALARLRKEPISLSCSLGTAANLARWQDNPEQALALAEELIAMAGHGAPPVLVGQARLLRYWARLRLGFVTDDAEIAPALEDIRRMTPAMEAVGHIILAEAACAAGVAPESRAPIERAIASGDRYGHTHYHAVLYRLLAEWHTLHGDPTHAASWLARAESLALRQGNRWAMARGKANCPAWPPAPKEIGWNST